MQAVFLIWLIPALLGALSVYLSQWRRGVIPLKLAVTAAVLILILGDAFTGGLTAVPSRFIIGIVFALSASMIGDYFLSRGEETFIPGLAGYLGAHAGYLIAFLSLGRLHLWVLLIAALLLLLFLLMVLRPRLEGPVMLMAVGAYIALTALVLSAAFGLEGLPGSAKALFLLGALSIALSDFIIAWNKFIRSLRLDEFLILSTYYTAQVAIGMGCWLII